MSVAFLRQVAATPLPKSFTNAKDIDAVKVLRQAGLVIALLDEPSEGAAKVVAITQKGNAELLRVHYPAQQAFNVGPTRVSWLQLAARQTRSVIHRMSGNGNR